MSDTTATPEAPKAKPFSLRPPKVVVVGATPKAEEPKAAKAPAKPKAPKPAKEVKSAKELPPLDPRPPKISSGQGGPTISLEIGDLNSKERKVLDAFALPTEGSTREAKSIQDLAKVFAKQAGSKTRANSWTRNSLRRLVRGGLVDKAARGNFRLSAKAVRRLVQVAGPAA